MRIEVYTADWCGPSKRIRGALRRGGVSYGEINIVEEPNKAASMGIKAVPTTLIYGADGKEFKRVVGMTTNLISDIQELINE